MKRTGEPPEDPGMHDNDSEWSLMLDMEQSARGPGLIRSNMLQQVGVRSNHKIQQQQYFKADFDY